MSIECFKYEFEHKKGKRQLYHDFNYQIKKQNNSMYSSVDLICELLKTMHYAFILPWKLKGEKNEAVNLKCKII